MKGLIYYDDKTDASEDYIKVTTESIDLPKQVKKLPTVLSITEVDKLLDTLNTSSPLETRNKAMIELAYASGLRVSELVGLKLSDKFKIWSICEILSFKSLLYSSFTFINSHLPFGGYISDVILIISSML